VKCLETRATPEGYKRRRYESAGGLRHTTIEVPLEVWRGINRQGRGNDRAAAWLRARERDSMRRQARSLVFNGKSRSDVAEVLAVSVRTVQRWTKGIAQA
jgi:hypothetical protein